MNEAPADISALCTANEIAVAMVVRAGTSLAEASSLAPRRRRGSPFAKMAGSRTVSFVIVNGSDQRGHAWPTARVVGDLRVAFWSAQAS
jgi:hypothetical protein